MRGVLRTQLEITLTPVQSSCLLLSSSVKELPRKVNNAMEQAVGLRPRRQRLLPLVPCSFLHRFPDPPLRPRRGPRSAGAAAPAARRFPPGRPSPHPRHPQAAALAAAPAPGPVHPAPAGAALGGGAAPLAPRPALRVQARPQGSGLGWTAAAQQAASLLAAAAERAHPSRLRWSPPLPPTGRQRYGHRRVLPHPHRRALQPQVAALVLAAALREVVRPQGGFGVWPLHRLRGHRGRNRAQCGQAPDRLRHGEVPQRGPRGHVQFLREVSQHRRRLRRCCHCYPPPPRRRPNAGPLHVLASGRRYSSLTRNRAPQSHTPMYVSVLGSKNTLRWICAAHVAPLPTSVGAGRRPALPTRRQARGGVVQVHVHSGLHVATAPEAQCNGG